MAGEMEQPEHAEKPSTPKLKDEGVSDEERVSKNPCSAAPYRIRLITCCRIRLKMLRRLLLGREPRSTARSLTGSDRRPTSSVA